MKKLVVLASLAMFAQQPSSTDQSDLVIRERVNIVIAPTTVLDKNNNYVNGLEPRDFRLYDNGKLQTIQQDIAFIPLSVVVAIQRSASTEEVLPALKRIGTMLETLVLGETGEAAILQFDHRIEKLVDFTNDGAKLTEALQNLRPGSTSSVMNDAIIESVRMLKNRGPNRRRVILLIAETKDNGSGGRIREALREIQFNNVIVYPVNMSRWLNKLRTRDQPPRPSPLPPSAMPPVNGMPNTPNTQMQMGYGGSFGNWIPVVGEIFTATKAIFVDNPQELLSKYSGGNEQSFVSLSGLEEAIRAIGEELHSQYLLSYNPNNKEDGGFHTIRVEVTKPNLTVRTRAGYWMAAVPN
jgi:VWFA-related protein